MHQQYNPEADIEWENQREKRENIDWTVIDWFHEMKVSSNILIVFSAFFSIKKVCSICHQMKLKMKSQNVGARITDALSLSFHVWYNGSLSLAQTLKISFLYLWYICVTVRKTVSSNTVIVEMFKKLLSFLLAFLILKEIFFILLKFVFFRTHLFYISCDSF